MSKIRNQNTSEDAMYSLLYIGAFQYEVLLRERKMIDPVTQEVRGVIDFTTWQAAVLPSLYDSDPDEQHQKKLQMWRPQLPKLYIKSKAAVIGSYAYLNGKLEINAWSSYVLSKLSKQECFEIWPCLHEVYDFTVEASKIDIKAREANRSLRYILMNSNQRPIIFIGLLLVSAMLIYPPWKTGSGRSLGYHLFFSLSPGGYGSAYLDWSRLGLQCLIIGVLLAAILFIFRGKGQ